MDEERSVARSSVVMAVGTIVSRLLGFIRAVLLALVIGVTTDAADAFGVANQLPNNVYAIIAGGVLNAVLVPQLVRARRHTDGGQGYIDRFVTLAISVFFIVTLLVTISAPLLVRLYTAGWSEEQLALATAFAYWCLPQLFFYGMYSVFGEVLNSRSAFGPFMWAPVLNNLVAIAGLVAFVLIFGADAAGNRGISSWDASQVTLLAGTATLGVAAQALILLVSWRRIGVSLRLNFKWRGFGLGPALKAAGWSLAMVLVTQIGGLVQTMVASTAAAARAGDLAVASVAAASIAWLVFMLPHSVVTVSVATAYFTRMSQHASTDEWSKFRSDLTAGLRVIGLVSVISSAILIVLAYPAARVFVGEHAGTVALGNVITALMLGLVPFSFVYMMQKAFFALEDTRTPFVFTSVQIAIHIIGSLTLATLVPATWLVVGLSLLTGFSILVQGTLAYALLRRKIGGLRDSGIVRAMFSFFVAVVPAAAIGWAAFEWFGGRSANSWALSGVLPAMLSASAVAALMALSYGLVLWTIRNPELRELSSQFRRRLGGRNK